MARTAEITLGELTFTAEALTLRQYDDISDCVDTMGINDLSFAPRQSYCRIAARQAAPDHDSQPGSVSYAKPIIIECTEIIGAVIFAKHQASFQSRARKP